MNHPPSLKLHSAALSLALLAALLLAVIPPHAPTTQAQGDACADAPAPRLIVGSQARVTISQAETLRLRAAPGLSEEQIGSLLSGQELDVVDGPLCSDGFRWWQLQAPDGLTGWAAEGTGSNYFLTPMRGAASPPNPEDTTCASVLPLIGAPGDRLRVTFGGQPVEARLLPATAAGLDSRWWAGNIFTIIDGPVCDNGYWWWRVTLPNGASAWIQIGDSLQYYVEALEPTVAPTATGSPTATETPTLTTTHTATFTATASPTATATFTVTTTATATPTRTPTATHTATLTLSPTATGTPNATNTLHPTSTPRPTLTPTPTVDSACWTAPLPRLEPDAEGEVTGVDALHLRDLPAVGAGEVAMLRNGMTFTVLEGPLCNSGYNWYRIQLPAGSIGWAAEGSGPDYWLQPAQYERPPLADRVCLAWGDNRGLHITRRGSTIDLAGSETGRVAGLAVSPNGRFLAVLRAHSRDAVPERLEIIDLASGDMLVSAAADTFGDALAAAGDRPFLWTPDSGTLLVNGVIGDTPIVWTVSLFGEATRLPLDGWQAVRFNPAGDQLALVEPDGWGAAIADLSAAEPPNRIGPPDAPPTGGAPRTAITWLDDGRMAAAFAIAPPGEETAVQWTALVEPDGTAALTEMTLPVSQIAWSPADGQVAYTSSGSLWLTTDLNGVGMLFLPLSGADESRFGYSWAPSGRALLVDNVAEPGAPVMVLNLETGEPLVPAVYDEDSAWTYRWIEDTILLAATDNASRALVNQPTHESFWLTDPLDGSSTLLLDLENVIFGAYTLSPDGCMAPPTGP